MRKTIDDIKKKKQSHQKIVMLTAYDFPVASILDQAGVDIILVGDSLAHVVLGLDSTKDVGMAEMLHHAKAVNRAVKEALLVGDMPFSSYQINPSTAVINAKRFIVEAGCDAVKLEWFDHCLGVAKEIIEAGIPVMGHVGLTPQRADELGGYKVQGNTQESAARIIDQAQALAKAGCFSLVLECIPHQVAEIITREVAVPTIGIGAGAQCDGQVLVIHDILGLESKLKPKFVKQYASLGEEIRLAVLQFKQEVVSGQFPDADHSYTIPAQAMNGIRSQRGTR